MLKKKKSLTQETPTNEEILEHNDKLDKRAAIIAVILIGVIYIIYQVIRFHLF
ncbi:MAG: hypothetical protein R3Y54_06240 [Eubacteriales bacterium]